MVRNESKSPKRANGTLPSKSGGSVRRITEAFPEVGRRIRVFKNGDPYDHGMNVVLNVRKIHDIGAFLDVVNERIGMAQGAKKLYTLNGLQVKTTSELENGKEYVASPGAFTPVQYGKRKTADRDTSHNGVGGSVSRHSNQSRTSHASSGSHRSKSSEASVRRPKPPNEKPPVPKTNGTTPPTMPGYMRSKSNVQMQPKLSDAAKAAASKRIKKPVQKMNEVVKKSTNAVQNGSKTAMSTVDKLQKKTEEMGDRVKKQASKTKKKVEDVAGATAAGAGAVVAGATAAAVAAVTAADEKVEEVIRSPAPEKPKTPVAPKSPSKSVTPDSARPRTKESIVSSGHTEEATKTSSKDEEHEEEKSSGVASEEADTESEESGGEEDGSEEEEQTETETEDESDNAPSPPPAASRRQSVKSTKSIKS